MNQNQIALLSLMRDPIEIFRFKIFIFSSCSKFCPAIWCPGHVRQIGIIFVWNIFESFVRSGYRPKTAIIFRGIFKREPKSEKSIFWCRMKKCRILVRWYCWAKFRLLEVCNIPYVTGLLNGLLDCLGIDVVHFCRTLPVWKWTCFEECWQFCNSALSKPLWLY